MHSCDRRERIVDLLPHGFLAVAWVVTLVGGQRTLREMIPAPNSTRPVLVAALGAGMLACAQEPQVGPEQPASVTAGTFGHNGVITATQAQQLIDEQGYVNIHSTFRPAGEIRGQLLLLPEPASAALLIGAAGLILRPNRRRC